MGVSDDETCHLFPSPCQSSATVWRQNMGCQFLRPGHELFIHCCRLGVCRPAIAFSRVSVSFSTMKTTTAHFTGLQSLDGVIHVKCFPVWVFGVHVSIIKARPCHKPAQELFSVIVISYRQTCACVFEQASYLKQT